MSTPFLVADTVSKKYGSRRILTAASLRAVPGEVRVLLGRNGIGKSTLLKIAAGLIEPDAGGVHIAGQVFANPSLPQLARLGMFYLPDHEVLSSSLTLGAQLRMFEDRYGARSVADAAKLARVESLLDRTPRAFSGGELRRAELSLALVRRPKCLLADEPYRGIAPVDHDLLHDTFRQLAADGCAVVVTGHEVGSLLDVADHITWCTSGTTYELGPPALARSHEGFRREYGGRALD
jgi:ABC-type multidrug transport system ATPase subunit